MPGFDPSPRANYHVYFKSRNFVFNRRLVRPFGHKNACSVDSVRCDHAPFTSVIFLAEVKLAE